MLFVQYGIKHHLKHRLRLLMVTLSLALGVAIFVSSFESVMAAQDAIAASAQSMLGSAKWEVSRGRYLQIDESLVAKFREVPGALVSPIVQVTADTHDANPTNLLVVGIDLSNPDTQKLFGGPASTDMVSFVNLAISGSGIVVGKRFAAEHKLSEGNTLELQSAEGLRKLVVVGIVANRSLDVAAGGNVGFLNLKQAQQEFGHLGLVDKIAVSGPSKEKLQKICRTCQVEVPGKLSSAAEDALARIRSLLGISVIALMVGVLLIYNSVQVSVLERIQDIAILRALGATRVQVFTLLLSEWALIGLVASCFGIGLGSALAYLLLEYTKRTVNTMVPLVTGAHVQVGAGLIFAALVIGVGTALAAALFPVLTAAKVRPIEILRPYSYRRNVRYGPAAVTGGTIFVLTNIFVATQSVSYVIGLSVTAVEFFGVALMFPQFVFAMGRRLRKMLKSSRNSVPFLALDGLLKAPHRTAFTIMTFGCALMMTVATKALVVGFQESTGAWMSSAFPFDISMMGNDLASSVYGSQVLPNSLAAKVREIPGVESAYAVRKLFTPFRSKDVMAIGIDVDRYLAARKNKHMGLWPPELSQTTVMDQFRRGSGVFVSTNFARLYNVRAGDTLDLETPTGLLKLRVLAEADDYSWQHGAFITSLDLLKSRWKDDAVSYVDASVANGYTVSEIKQKLQQMATGDRTAFAYDKAEIREVTDSVLEQTVAMANLQALIAILIGVLGIVNAIWIGVMNRKREIAMWRSIGMTRKQVATIIVCESVFVSSVAALVGVIGGLYGGWVPLRSFSFNVTGYLYPCVIPWAHLLVVTVVALILGVLAGLFPARQASNMQILESIGYE